MWQEILRLWWNRKVRNRIYKSRAPVPVFSQTNPAHVPSSNFLNIYFNIIHPSKPRFSKWSLSFSSPCTHLSYPCAVRCNVTSLSWRQGVAITSPTHKLMDHTFSAVRECTFYIFAATLHTGGLYSIRNLRMRQTVATGTRLSQNINQPVQQTFALSYW